VIDGVKVLHQTTCCLV